jgi:hypothetical protein
MQSSGSLRKSRARKCHTFILIPRRKLHHVVLLILVSNTACWRLRPVVSRRREQLHARSGLLSHGSVDCHISSYFRCWNLLECETMWRRAPDKVALKSSWKLVWRTQELRGWQFDRWGMQSRLDYGIWEGTFKTWSWELLCAGRLWRYFREGRKEVDGWGWFVVRFSVVWVRSVSRDSQEPKSPKTKGGLERTSPQNFFS